MNHWSQVVERLLRSKTGDLKELAKMAGVSDPKFYSFQSLEGCDLRGQDLTGLDLTGCDIDKAIVDKMTIIDPDFEFRDHMFAGYYTFDIPFDLNVAILEFSKRSNYVYKAWAYKNLLSRFRRLFRSRAFQRVFDTIVGSESLLNWVVRGHVGKKQEITMLIEAEQLDVLRNFESRYPQFDSKSFAFLAGLIAIKSPYKRLGLPESLPLELLWGMPNR